MFGILPVFHKPEGSAQGSWVQQGMNQPCVRVMGMYELHGLAVIAWVCLVGNRTRPSFTECGACVQRGNDLAAVKLLDRCVDLDPTLAPIKEWQIVKEAAERAEKLVAERRSRLE